LEHNDPLQAGAHVPVTLTVGPLSVYLPLVMR
jgi:hypothetical protein